MVEEVIPSDIETSLPVWDIAFHPHHDVLCVGLIDGHVHVYQYVVDDTQLLFDLRYHRDGVRAMEFSPDGQCLYSVSSDGTVKALDCNSRTVVFDKRETGHPEEPNALVFATDSTFATGCDGGLVQLWDRRQPEPVMQWDDVLGTGINCLAYNPADSMLIAGTDDGTVALFNTRKAGAEAAVITGSTDDGVCSMALMSCGGLHLACGCSSGRVRVWKYGRWTMPSDTLQGHPAEVEGMVALRDGDVATASCDGCVRAVRLLPVPRLLDTLGSLDESPSVRLKASRCGALVAAGGGPSVQFFDVRRFRAGAAAAAGAEGAGTAFLRQADGDAAAADDDDEEEEEEEESEEEEGDGEGGGDAAMDEDSDSSDDGGGAGEEKEKWKGKHKLDFKSRQRQLAQKKFFGGL
eukprot:TRINITY_DN21865_c0_g1_i1.p1 TRINITY_DN21865_c0_g1~~TRINITY_DN21865_c0_g1_i1.p1  ORF type:complete len:406 (+),score=133.06 TRINITY_DN21865_c0_g1_i1:70-1287(+)